MKKLFLLLMAVFAISLCASAQTRTVKGTVIDESTDEPVIGASVVPAGYNAGATTDVDGHFSLVINSKVKEITVSYVGMKTKTVPVSDNMTIYLAPTSELLDAVIVTGYGSGKKLGSVVGSVAVVGEATFENVSTPSFVDALQGQVSGLSVLSSSGDPSSLENEVRLRGVNSLNSSLTPLFILDGAPVTATVFSTLNPSDIQSITVLKDAASVAIYGSRAANGVIVITSKKGKHNEKANVTLRAKYGWSQMADENIEMMNSRQYVKYRDLIGQPVSDEQRYAAEVLGIDTDWRSEIFDGSAPTYSLEGSISGGSESTTYYLSLNHLDQQGIIEQSGMRRETLRISLATRINDWFRVGFQGNLGYTKYQTNNESNAIYSGAGVYGTNPMVVARRALPMDSPYYYTFDENGNVVWGDKAYYLHYTKMPLPSYNDKNRRVWRNRLTINANIFEQINPIEGLTIRAQQAVDAYDSRLKNTGFAHSPLYTPMGDSYEVDSANEEGVVEGYNQQSFSRYYSFTYTNTAEYKFKIAGVHNISALAGHESIITNSEGFGVFSEGHSDVRQPLLYQGTSVSVDDLSQTITEASMNSFFFNASYNYDDKYFFEANYRRDGSSYFAPGHRWAGFYSLGAMWNAKSEKFLADVKWLDDARLRVSYGTTGNSSFANYAYFGLVGSGSNYNGSGSLGISQVPNPELSWETVKSFDAGINVGLIGIFNVDVDFYNKNTYDMLMAIPYSYTTGVGSGWGNIASMRNTGVDVDVRANILNTKDWSWDVRANFNYNKNQITKLFNGLDELAISQSSIIYKKGHVANEFYMVRYAGVDPRDGKQMWYTREGNLTKTFNEERDAVCTNKSQYAPWSGGFGTGLRWKDLSLRMDFTWAANKYMVNNDLWFIQNNTFSQTYNQTTEMLNVWTTPGQVTDIPAAGQELQFDDRWLEDASFVRLKNLTVQYSLPKSLISKAQLSEVNIHFTGRNLLTFTGFTGYDPEPESNIVAFFYPNTRQYEIGIDVTF